MANISIPILSNQDIQDGFQIAQESIRGRHVKILHNPGDYFNQAFNFVTRDSYMQPHMHPSDEKIEEIFIVKGSAAILYFNNDGEVTEIINLEPGGIEKVTVPAFTWHTYVMMDDKSITYETMMGKYDPKTWKKMAPWAPDESNSDSGLYLEKLRLAAINDKPR